MRIHKFAGEYPPVSQSFKTGSIDCMTCGRRIMYPLQDSDDLEYEIIRKQDEHIRELHNGYELLLNEIQDFFPQTPISEFLEMRRQKFQDFVRLSISQINGTTTEAENIILKGNEYYQEMLKQLKK